MVCYVKLGTTIESLNQTNSCASNSTFSFAWGTEIKMAFEHMHKQ